MLYVDKLITLLKEVKGWILGIIAIITVVVVAINCCKYLSGNGGEKADAMASIKKNLIMGGGSFFLVWLAEYVVTKMK